jgi:hypothetical protein
MIQQGSESGSPEWLKGRRPVKTGEEAGNHARRCNKRRKLQVGTLARSEEETPMKIGSWPLT